jgi:hypothetical protein
LVFVVVVVLSLCRRRCPRRVVVVVVLPSCRRRVVVVLPSCRRRVAVVSCRVVLCPRRVLVSSSSTPFNHPPHPNRNNRRTRRRLSTTGDQRMRSVDWVCGLLG